MKKITSDTIIFILLFQFFSFSCNDDNPVKYDVLYEYTEPALTNDGWETASLTDVGLDSNPITQYMNELLNNIQHKIHGILIIKNGKLVLEEYFPGYVFYHGPLMDFNRETKHNLASVTKSFTSALIGLSIDQGLIQDVNQKAFAFFPEYQDLNNDGKDKITLEHLLTMTSGLEWDESTYPYTDVRNDVAQLFRQSDPIRYILNKPLETEPGILFYYNSGLTNILGEIIRKASGMRADVFAREYLFSPLGITDYEWQMLPNNVLYTSGDLKLRPRDMAKLGYLYLNSGIWKSQQIVPKWWVEASTDSFIRTIPERENGTYGYQWWVYTYEVNSKQVESSSARGWGGQNIIVFPGLNLVVVTTAGYYDEPHSEFHIELLLYNIIEAAI